MATIEHIKDLIPDPRNARAHTPRNVGMIEAALGEVGAARSIVIDEDGVVLAGNATIEAAAQAGIERVQVVDADGNTIIAVRRSGLTPEQKTRLALFDNRSSELADWDASVLAALSEEMDLSTLFRDDELAALLAQEAVDIGGAGDEFDATPEDGPTRTQAGDLWLIDGGRHRLLVGDCTDAANVERLMGGERAGAVVTDPPYGIDASSMTMGKGQSDKPRYARLSFGQEWDGRRPDIRPLLEITDWICIWGGNYFADVLPITNDWLCWWKKNDERSFSEFELAWTNFGCNARHFAHHWGGEEKEHITQKPVAVMTFCIEQCPGAGIILDPFGGSGTTLIAAHSTGRRAFLMEIAPRYAGVILRRAEAAGLSVARGE